MLEVDIALALAICNLQRALCRKLNQEGGKACPNWTEYSILEYLQRDPGANIQALASYAGITSGSATYTLDRLETAGLIVRKRAANDSRISNIYLTIKGEIAISELQKKLSEVSRGVFEGIIEEKKISMLVDLESALKDASSR